MRRHMRWVLCLAAAWPAAASAQPAPNPGAPAPVSPQEPAPAVEEARPALAVTLRPTPELLRLAQRAARMIARRTGSEVLVGEPPPPAILEAVPRGHLGMALLEGRLLLVLGADDGISFATQLTLPRRGGEARVRAVALAIESLRDAAAQGPPEAGEESETLVRHGSTWTLVGGLPRGTPREPLAKPTIYLRLLLGVSPLRGTFLVGPGTGLGLCVGPHCVVLEGDLPLVAEERLSEDGTPVAYQAVNFSVRFQFRPFRWGDLTPAITAGLMTRVGTARLAGATTGTVATSLGVRSTLELAWEFVDRFEAVLEAGADVAINRASFHRRPAGIMGGETVFLEDRWTPWFVVSFRLRPGA